MAGARRFEYLTERLKLRGFVGLDEVDEEALQAMLDESGAEGWELVQVLPRQVFTDQPSPAHLLIYRRPLDPEA